MKLYKSLLFGLLVCGMAACDTTDLERDINSLKDRVEDYEAQVQKLNDDMNIIRVLLDGNKTITSYSFDGTNYTLTLSNGETLTLTQGVVGANYPSITIDEESGNWIIAGKDSGVKAEAEDGKDAPYTPQFKIENGTWWVSYDGKKTWENLGVVATGTPSDKKSPITDVDTTDPNFIKITLKGEPEPRVIPVIRDLVCEITEPELADGEMWYIGDGATLKVKVNIQPGDIIRPVVPADWEAEIVTDYSSLSGEQTLEVEVTPPSGASKCVVTMEVNRGANTVTDEIVARTETTSYYADFMAGMDIQVGSVTLNKYMFEESEIHAPSESETTLTAAGIYFLNSEATVSLSANLSNVKKLVVIGNTPSASLEQMPTIKYTGNFYMSLGGNTGGLGLLLKNVKIDASSSTTYSFNIGSAFVDANTYFENLVFDRCNILFSSGNSFVYVNNSTKKMPIQNIEICNTLLSSESAGQKYVFSFSNHEYEGFKNFTVENSVFYCRTENAAITNFSLMQCANEKGIGFENIKVKNNTFVNVIPANQLVKVKMFNVDFSNNLLWRNTDKGGYLLYGIKGSVFGTASFADNMYYNADNGTVSFNLFHTDGVVPDNVTNSLQKLSSDPFETLNVTNAQFDLLPAYQNVGAHLE
ncbi:PL29 family lyase N-terminal domain-containing protein [Phocaeicola plebeius]|uniref:PL29 family lyase N-terminal domain-containing protein n=1 Tax=Phocaeicola plebeius TaxID=310297 RepID=UPI0026F35D3E|nr:PL29 family lyase N-terminal domain-containing protein [Phocaeicola plebeius]